MIPDYESLYRNQVRVTDEVENLRRGLMDILVKREQRIRALQRDNQLLRADRVFCWSLAGIIVVICIFTTLITITGQLP